MWVIFLVEIAVFYLLALLQNSFFIHFSLAGATPNLILALFLTLLFFGKKNNFYLFFLSVLAGIFLDIFSAGYLGVSIIILFAIGLLAKKVQISLKEGEDNYSFIFFILIFAVAQALYDFISQLPNLIKFDAHLFLELIWSVLCASLLFFLIKKLKLERFLK